jgi:Family of unknown function (DUF6151)
LRHQLQCRCGTIQGFVDDPSSATRSVCYCKSCQAFAHFLGQGAQVLDERGGSDVIQISAANLTLTQGAPSLACVRLTEKGLLRWYANCCKTPIGNTLPNPKISFVGLIHNCLEAGGQSIEESFGRVRTVANTDGAKGTPKPKSSGTAHVVTWFIGTILKARISGRYKRTPFFDIDRSTPIVTPRVLSREERAGLLAQSSS